MTRRPLRSRHARIRRPLLSPRLEPLEDRIQLSLTPVTGVTALTSAAYDQNAPSVAMDAAGDYVVAWENNYDSTGITSSIRAEIFNPNGSVKVAPFTVNSTATPATTTRQHPSVAMDANGDFVVAWELEPAGYAPGGGYYFDIQARRFSLSGAAQGSEFRVNSTQTKSPAELNNPTVGMNNNSIVIGWGQAGASSAADSVKFQRYSFSGSTTQAVGGNVTVATGNLSFEPSVAMDTAGDFVYLYNTYNGSVHQVYDQVYNASGVAQTGVTAVGPGNTINGVVAMNGAGHFVAAYEVSSGSNAVYAHQYALTGSESSLSVTSLSGDVPVYPEGSTRDQREPSAAIDSQGFATIAWLDYSTSNLANNDYYYTRRLNPDGSLIESTPVVVASPSTAVEYNHPDTAPQVAVDSNGDPIFAFESDAQGAAAGTGVQVDSRLYYYVNDAPTIAAITNQTIAENGSTSVPLSNITAGGNEEQTLTVTASSSNTALINPTVTYTSPNSTGTLNLTPVAGQYGTATITVTVTDSGGTTHSGINTVSTSFTLTVVGPPTANAQSVTTAFNTAKAITLTGSDPNTPARTLTYTIVTNTTHGTLSGSGSSYTYTPYANYQGADSFTFTTSNGYGTSSQATVSITVTPGTPTANNQSVTVTHDTATPITLTSTDPDSPALALTYSFTQPAHGSVVVSGSTGSPTVVYTPNTGYNGTDTFTFTTSNGTNTSNTATVTLTVGAATPTATAQSVTVAHDTAKAITLSGTDGDDNPAQTLTYTVVTSPGHGKLSGSGANLTYTPNSGYNGTDTFTFRVTNTSNNTSSAATVTLTVGAATPTANAQSVTVTHDTAKAITLSGTDGDDSPAQTLTYTIVTSPTHGTLSGTAPNLTYTPTTGYNGSDSFTFTVSNGTNTSSAATVTLTVGAGTPTATSESFSTNQNTAVATPLAGTDGDDNPALPLTYTVTTAPTHGTLSGSGANLTYTPATGYTGSDSFAYTVSNGTNTSTPATVSLTVNSTVATVSGSVQVGWGTAGTTILQTNGDGLRLLPAGRSTDLPFLGINQITITLSKAAPLSPADVSVTGITVANYGPVTISGSGTTYTITLAQPINAADRVTVTIANANIATFTRRLDVLPGDFNDDGVVTQSDAIGIRNEYLGIAGATPTVAGDINGDGVVDINDYNVTRRLIGTTLP